MAKVFLTAMEICWAVYKGFCICFGMFSAFFFFQLAFFASCINCRGGGSSY